MPTIDLPQRETTKIVDASDPQGNYEFTVGGADIRISDRKADAPEGRTVQSNRDGVITKDRKTERLYAFAPNADSSIDIDKTRFSINLYPPMVLTSERTNKDGIVGDSVNAGASQTSFSDQAVPDGFNAVVQNDPGNNDNVSIVDDGGTQRHVLSPGATISLGVSNLDQITVYGTGNTPTVNATVEAP